VGERAGGRIFTDTLIRRTHTCSVYQRCQPCYENFTEQEAETVGEPIAWKHGENSLFVWTGKRINCLPDPGHHRFPLDPPGSLHQSHRIRGSRTSRQWSSHVSELSQAE